MDNFKQISKLKSAITYAIHDELEHKNLPKSFTFCERPGGPTFTISISISEPDFFIDEKGVKWVKQIS